MAPLAHADSRVFPTGYWAQDGLLSCTGNYNQVTPISEGPTNTCNSFCDLLKTGQNVIDFAVTIVIFIGAPAMIVFGGVTLMLAGSGVGGEGDKRSTAKSIIVSAVVGVAITLSAYVILSTFLWLTGAATTDGVAPGAGDPNVVAPKVSWPDVQCDAN